MNPTHSPETPRDIDLHRTQRTFLFAREQVAAQTKGYLAHSRARHWAAYRHPVSDAPHSPIR